MEKSISAASDDMEKAMIDNLQFSDTQHGIINFLTKKKPTWSHTDEKFNPE